MERKRGGRLGWLIGAACALSACEGDKPAPSFDYDPTLVEDAGMERPPRPTPVGGGGGRGDAGGAKSDAGPKSDAAVISDAGSADDASAGPELGELASAERLLIGDGLEQRLYAYDVNTRQLLDTFTVGSRARVYAGPGGRYGYALPSAGGPVRIVDMGFVESAVGGGRALAQPALLPQSLPGSAPGALLSSAGWVGVSFDGDGSAVLVREAALPQLDTVELALGAAQAGFALRFGDGFLATRAERGQIGLARYAADGRLEPGLSMTCEAPEGAALAGGELAIGCANGVLRLTPDGAEQLVPYAGAAGRARRLVGHPGEALYLTVIGDALCLVDAALSCQPLPQPAVDIGFDASGKRALVLSSDGVLRAFDAGDLRAQGMLRVTSAVVASDELTQPQLASGRRFTYISDPQASAVHIVDTATLTLSGRVDLPGSPAKLAVFRFR